MSPFRLALTAALLAASVAAPAQAATRGGVSVEILVDGRPLDELIHEGKTYVEARRGRNYSIRLHNERGERVAVALSVDGLNSIDASHTAARDAKKWVLGPYESAEISGWQVDDAHARRFLFTSEEKSYGAWLGDTRNLGTIAAVVYQERPSAVCCTPPPRRPVPYAEDELDMRGSVREESRSRGGDGTLGRGKASSSADAPMAEAEAAAPSPRGAKKKDELAATGMGSRTRHEVQWTSFDLDPDPVANFSFRYAYRDELLSLGIDPDWASPTPAVRRRERAVGFAPEPDGACCR